MNSKLFAIIIFIILSFNTLAQHSMQSSFYTDNKFLINPANTGDKESCPVFLLGYRNNFIGIPGALRRPMLGYHSPVSKEMGLGALVSFEELGIFDYYSLGASYSYTVNLSKQNILRLGLSSGIYSRRVNRGRIDVDQLNDDALQTEYNSDVFYFGGAGFELGLQDAFFVNFSIPKLYSGEDKHFAQTVIGGLEYKIRMENQILKPSIYYNYFRGLPSRADINLTYRYPEMFSIQASARTDKTFALGAGIEIKNLILSYVYEFNTSLMPNSKGSHEILISYSLEPVKFSPTGRRLNK